MKKLITLCVALVLTTLTFAQAPEKMSYQAVIRDNAGALVSNSNVGTKISILQGSASGTAVYVETQTLSSNANGLISLEIGTGTVVSGNLSSIDWSNDLYFIKTETDPNGGTNYTISGTSQLMSVPYALYAKTSGSSTPGQQGVAGTNGTNGVDGADGKSAYEIAVNNGFVGTETDWLTSMKGETGAQGIQGAKGDKGDQGETGLLTTGSAGEIAYHNGTTWVTLGAGTAGQVLQSNGTNAPSWGTLNVYYADRDGDGSGDKYSAYSSFASVAPSGYVANNTDCNDNDPNNTTIAPIANAVTNRASTTFTATWTAVTGATSYALDVATDNSFLSFVSGYNNQNVGNVTSVALSGLDACTNYYFRVRAVSACGTSANSSTISAGTFQCQIFNYTGSDQTWAVPTGVTNLNVELRGAGGGPSMSGWNYGAGGMVIGTLSVTSGSTITLVVGGKGVDYSNGGGAIYGGGGARTNWNGGGGGGRSAIQISGSDVVTAGGGGGGGVNAGGAGGAEGSGSGGSGGGSNGGAGGTSYTTNPLFTVSTTTSGSNGGAGVIKISW